jgi:hypothetical protein
MIFGTVIDNKLELRDFLAQSLRTGVSKFGHELLQFEKERFDEVVLEQKMIDVLVVIGVMGYSSEKLDQVKEAGVTILYIDKGYIRIGDPDYEKSKCKYYRFAINDNQPHDYFLNKQMPGDRWDALNIPILPMKKYKQGSVIFAGSSQKYCNYQNLGDANEYAKQVFRKVRKFSKRDNELVYRPKPSWKGAERIEGTFFCGPNYKLFTYFKQKTHCVISHGSNANLEALIAGIPSFVLGNGIVRSLSRTSLGDIDRAHYPDEQKRYELFSNIAYHQYSVDEILNGSFWEFLKDFL